MAVVGTFIFQCNIYSISKVGTKKLAEFGMHIKMLECIEMRNINSI